MNLRKRSGFLSGPSLLAVFSLLSLPALPTHASIFKKIKKGASSATKTVTKEVTKDANKTANAVSDATKQVTDEVAEISADEAKVLTETAKKSYTKTLKEGESAYQQTMATVKSGIDAAKEAALRSAAQEFLKKYSGFLKKFRSNVDALAQDDNAVAIVERLAKAASEKRLDDQTRADLLVIGERLGLLDWKPNAIVPGSSGGATKSSWGLAVTGGGAYIGGAEGSAGLVANCYKESDQRYGAGLAVSVGGVLGAAFGGSVSVTFFWQPGGVESAEGGYVGLGVEGAYAAIGGTVGVQWSVTDGMKGASAGTPGFVLGWAGGVKVKAGALQGGYTFVPVKSVK